MANISYDYFEASNNNDGGGFKNSVGFFSLKNDGDDAIVRILHNSVEDFDMLSCHSVVIGGKYKKINCLREPREPMNKCPLCEAGIGKLQQRMFIHLIQYAKDENGNIVALPKIWERSVSYAKTLKGYIDEYGPLEKRVFKIRRYGEAGSMQTNYTFLPQDSSIYSEAQYPIDKSGFERYSVLGTLVMNKNYDDCVAFVRDGSFPGKDQSKVEKSDWGNAPKFTPASPRVNQEIPNTPNTPNMVNSNTGYVNHNSTGTTPFAGQMPWETGSSTPPRRYN